MPDSSTTDHSILNILPDYPISNQRCLVHIQQKADLILLALEALEMGSSDFIFNIAKELHIEHLFNNRLVIWRLRCSNPWRRSYTHNTIDREKSKALIMIASHRAKQLTVQIRTLLVAEQQMREKNLPVGTSYLLSEYLEQFRSYFRSRMNPRRTKVAWYLSEEEELNTLALSLLHQLLFCTGTVGVQRFWISLFDGEVA